MNTAQNAANGSRKAPFERSLYEYTSALRLPWQCLRDGAKNLDFIGFLGRQHRIYTLFTPLEDRIGKAEII